ncbi:hypothetical protein Tco_1266403 [Tanacetum coccineum]
MGNGYPRDGSQSMKPCNIHHGFSIRGCGSPSPYQNPLPEPPQAPHLQHPPSPSVEPFLVLLLLVLPQVFLGGLLQVLPKGLLQDPPEGLLQTPHQTR